MYRLKILCNLISIFLLSLSWTCLKPINVDEFFFFFSLYWKFYANLSQLEPFWKRNLVVTNTLNPSSMEAEGGGSLRSRPACSTEWVPGQSRLYRETVSWNQPTSTNQSTKLTTPSLCFLYLDKGRWGPSHVLYDDIVITISLRELWVCKGKHFTSHCLKDWTVLEKIKCSKQSLSVWSFIILSKLSFQSIKK